jgi:hypothetical protein
MPTLVMPICWPAIQIVDQKLVMVHARPLRLFKNNFNRPYEPQDVRRDGSVPRIRHNIERQELDRVEEF